MSDVLIDVNNVSKKLCRDLRKSLAYGVQDLLAELLGSNSPRNHLRDSEFWAVRNVNISVRRGECMGLIGKNGAGKTTLLRMLSGLIRPDEGRIEMRGSVGAMIALGAGMKDILTGRDNILAMAALRGMSRKEILARVNEIIDFAELREAIDAPLQSYSSGMRVRLNFAIASAMDPDVLLLDEVLAVGDAAFRNKCYRRIAELRRDTAVIFVSHNLEQISRICDSVTVLDKGQVCYSGSVNGGLALYDEINVGDFDASGNLAEAFLSTKSPIDAFDCRISRDINFGADLEISASIFSVRPISGLSVRLVIYNQAGDFVADGFCKRGLSLCEGSNAVDFVVPALRLRNGFYFLGINVIDEVGDLLVWSYKQHRVYVSGGYAGAVAEYLLELKVVS